MPYHVDANTSHAMLNPDSCAMAVAASLRIAHWAGHTTLTNAPLGQAMIDPIIDFHSEMPLAPRGQKMLICSYSILV